MTTYTWKGTGTGVWGTSGNWMPTGVPSTTADAAQFTGTSTYTAEIATGITYTVGLVLLDDPNATFDLLGNLNVGTQATPGTFTITSGTLIIDSASGAGNNSRLRYATVADNGGTVEFAGGTLIDVTWQGTLDLSAANAKVKVNVTRHQLVKQRRHDRADGRRRRRRWQRHRAGDRQWQQLWPAGLPDLQQRHHRPGRCQRLAPPRQPWSWPRATATQRGAAQVTLGSGVQVTSDGTNALAQISSKTASDVIINQGTITAGGVRRIVLLLAGGGAHQPGHHPGSERRYAHHQWVHRDECRHRHDHGGWDIDAQSQQHSDRSGRRYHHRLRRCVRDRWQRSLDRLRHRHRQRQYRVRGRRERRHAHDHRQRHRYRGVPVWSCCRTQRSPSAARCRCPTSPSRAAARARRSGSAASPTRPRSTSSTLAIPSG